MVKESARAFSCTKRPELVEVSIGEQSFLMIDTPGFNDTDKDSTRSDGKILGEIARTLILQTQMGVKLVRNISPFQRHALRLIRCKRGILILYDISASRMTGDKRRQLEMIKTICGKTNYSNVLLVTTHWPKDYLEQIEQGCAVREGDLRSDFWKDMVKGGSKMVRFDNDEDSARAIVGPLAEKPDITLALQAEMASGRKLSATSAGAYVLNARREDEEILKSLQAKAKKLAKDPNNPELVKEIEELQASIEAQKADETKLDGDIVSTIRKEIRDLDQEARKRGRKPTVANIVSWLIGLSGFTVQLVQTIFTGTSS